MITLRTSIDPADPFGRDVVEFVLPNGDIREPMRVAPYRIGHASLMGHDFRLMPEILRSLLSDEQGRVWLAADWIIRPRWFTRIEWECRERLGFRETGRDAREVQQLLEEIHRRLLLGETLKGSPPKKGSPLSLGITDRSISIP